MHCRICGKKSDETRICPECSYLLKNGADEETLRKMYSDDKTKKIWVDNKKISEHLANAYYSYVLDNYKGHFKKDSKENFGYNTFVDGINLGLDIVVPLLGEETQNKVKEKIDNMIKIRAKKILK